MINIEKDDYAPKIYPFWCMWGVLPAIVTHVDFPGEILTVQVLGEEHAQYQFTDLFLANSAMWRGLNA